LFDVLDSAFSRGAERRDQQRHAGAYIGAAHGDPAQRVRSRKADHRGAVGIAEYYLGAHVEKLVYEEQAALEHFLVDEYAAARLGGHYQHDAQQVGRETRPGMVVDRKHAAIEVGLNFVYVLRGNMNIIADDIELNAQLPEF